MWKEWYLKLMNDGSSEPLVRHKDLVKHEMHQFLAERDPLFILKDLLHTHCAIVHTLTNSEDFPWLTDAPVHLSSMSLSIAHPLEHHPTKRLNLRLQPLLYK